MFKFLFLIFIFLKGSILCFAQKSIKLSGALGVGITIPKIYDSRTKVIGDKGYYALCRGEYIYNKSLTICPGIGFLRYKNHFTSPFTKLTVQGVQFKIDNLVTINSIIVPLDLKLRLKKNLYINGGIGANFNLASKRYAQVIATYDLAHNRKDFEEIENDKIQLKTINPFYTVGFGSDFNFCSKNLWIEIGFWSHLNKQTYKTIDYYSDFSYKFTNRMIFCHLGYFIDK